jgi:hypothetical protein
MNIYSYHLKVFLSSFFRVIASFFELTWQGDKFKDGMKAKPQTKKIILHAFLQSDILFYTYFQIFPVFVEFL